MGADAPPAELEHHSTRAILSLLHCLRQIGSSSGRPQRPCQRNRPPRHHRDARIQRIWRRLSLDLASPPPRSSHCSQDRSRPVPGPPAPAPNCSHNPLAYTAVVRSRHGLSDDWWYDGKLCPALVPQPIPRSGTQYWALWPSC